MKEQELQLISPDINIQFKSPEQVKFEDEFGAMMEGTKPWTKDMKRIAVLSWMDKSRWERGGLAKRMKMKWQDYRKLEKQIASDVLGGE